MKNCVRYFCVFVFSLFSIVAFADNWDGKASDKSWYSETGSEYHIKHAAELKGLSDLVKSGISFEDKIIYLDADLNLLSQPWQPIGGNSGSVFNGVFDGKGHKIEHVHPVADPNSWYPIHSYGLFGEVGDKSELLNISVSGWASVVPQSMDFSIYVGGLVGNSSGKIENVSSDFNIDTDSNYLKSSVQTFFVGGICGKGDALSKVSAKGKIMFAYGNVYWRWDHCWMGGIAGLANKLDIVSSEMDISTWAYGKEQYVGGIVGQIFDGYIKNACFYGSLKVSEDRFVLGSDSRYTNCGGIVGGTNVQIEVSNCISAPLAIDTDFTGYYVRPIVGNFNSSTCSGNNNYYTKSTPNSESLASYIQESTLLSATSLPGFDNSIWGFTVGGKPKLKTFIVKHCISFAIDKGKIGYSVNDGDSLTLMLEAEEGYVISNVYLNDDDVTESFDGTYLRLRDISADGVVKVIFINDATSVEKVNAYEQPHFKIINNNIVFSEIDNTQSLEIYNMDGKSIVSKRIKSNDSIPLSSGIYIVKLGKKTYKIAM